MKESKIEFYRLSIPIKIALVLAWVTGIMYLLGIIMIVFGIE